MRGVRRIRRRPSSSAVHDFGSQLKDASLRLI
jgi:hypothetical protein